MYTDWLLIHRSARDLDDRLRGARVRDVGQLADGRFALALWKRGVTHLLCIDPFAPTPVVTIEEGELPIANEPGFVRAVGAALRASTLHAVRSRRGDRLLRLEFGSRSRFGVETGHALICELVPRFGNIVLVKDDTVVSAAAEFSLADNGTRAVEVGHRYEPPPLNASRIVPKLLLEGYGPERARELVDALMGEGVNHEPLFVYRRSGALVQAHLVALPQFAQLACSRESDILGLFAEDRAEHTHVLQSDRLAKRRRDLQRTLAEREKKLRAELAQIAGKLRTAGGRDSLREGGDAIYATLHELGGEAADEAKRRAAAFFAQYKKLGASAEHLIARRADLEEALVDLEHVRWEVERANEAGIEDAADAVAGLERRRSPARSRIPTRKRKPLQYATARGSRIFVGRTPLENADLTFRVARPNDLWFHVQNQPGAHVILQRDDREEPADDDLMAAASLAALHSKAKMSPKVTVDFTLRKYVRKRPSAAPGLVFYTRPRSLVVEPREPDVISSADDPRTLPS
ncbi:MAG: NFACT RNA binding domain-containing protein [Candidatus Eremiobacteraeota bacterium]|nr:NFACT RNA binding domain-containing protein [Candidatus Eremiobacteraeota bacterium]